MSSAVDLLRVCDESGYLESFLSRGLLPDGRTMAEWRPMAVQLGVISGARGSAMVRQGGVSVVASVRPRVSVPIDGRGFVRVTFDSSFHVDTAAFLHDELEDARACVQQLVATDAMICRRDLVVSEDRVAWTLDVNVLVLAADGGLTDGVLTAVMAALADVRLPKLTLMETTSDDVENAEDGRQFDLTKADIVVSETESSPLTLSDYPVSSTFVFYDDGLSTDVTVVCDPTADIVKHLPGSCNVVVGDTDVVYRLSRLGGPGLDGRTLETVMTSSWKRQKSVRAMIERALTVRE